MSSERFRELISFLDSQEGAERFMFLEEGQRDDNEAIENFSEVKVKMMSMRLELEEAHKTIDSLKLIVDKQQYQLEEKERFWPDRLKREIEKQQEIYEEKIEKNVEFIETLIKEKEERLKKIGELQLQMVKNEESFKTAIAGMEEKFKKELKREKDNWITSEKVRREKWEKEKIKEIKEITIKGMQPEFERRNENNRKTIEDLEERHRKELKKLRDELENKQSEEIVRVI
jgi:5-azacytidine-induced protein 1